MLSGRLDQWERELGQNDESVSQMAIDHGFFLAAVLKSRLLQRVYRHSGKRQDSPGNILG
jgi:hypothetical protein